MKRAMTIAMVLAVSLGASVSACGGDDSSGEAPKADAGKGSRLGEARFDALDAVYAAAVPLDKLRDGTGADTAKFRVAAKPLLDACDALDRDDALLGELRRGCPLLVTFNEQSATIATACQDQASCAEAISAVRTTLATLQRLSRSADRAVAAADITSECQDALRTPEQAYAAYEAVSSAFATLQRGATTGSMSDINKAESQVDALDDDDLPSAKESLEKFRGGCA